MSHRLQYRLLKGALGGVAKGGGSWRVWGTRYEKPADAEKALRALSLKHEGLFEFRVKEPKS